MSETLVSVVKILLYFSDQYCRVILAAEHKYRYIVLYVTIFYTAKNILSDRLFANFVNIFMFLFYSIFHECLSRTSYFNCFLAGDFLAFAINVNHFSSLQFTQNESFSFIDNLFLRWVFSEVEIPVSYA